MFPMISVILINIIFVIARNATFHRNYPSNGYSVLRFPMWIKMFILFSSCLFLLAIFDSTVVNHFDTTSRFDIFETTHDEYTITDVVFFFTMELICQLMLLILLNNKVYFNAYKFVYMSPIKSGTYLYDDIVKIEQHGEFIKICLAGGKKIVIGPSYFIPYEGMINQINRYTKYNKLKVKGFN